MNGKPTVWIARLHQRSAKREEKKDRWRTSNPSSGDGNRFVAYTASEPPTVEELKQKATALIFPGGKSAFAGSVDNMLLDICDTTQMAITRSPGGGTIESYLKENGLFQSTTYLYLRSQHQDTFFSQLKADKETFERPVNLNASQVASDAVNRVVCSVCSCRNPYTTETPETPETPVSLWMR